jgi:hypothetical protein
MSTQHARPWPAIDVVELRYGLAFGSSVEEIADFLQRDVDDVRHQRSRPTKLRRDRLADGRPVGGRHVTAATPRRWSELYWTRYWITWSASSRIDCGTVKPSALAVLAFKAIWKLTGARTGGLVGFSPLRMRSTKDAERRVMSALLVP